MKILSSMPLFISPKWDHAFLLWKVKNNNNKNKTKQNKKASNSKWLKNNSIFQYSTFFSNVTFESFLNHVTFPRVLFDCGIKLFWNQIILQVLRFHLCIATSLENLLQLLEITGCQRYLFFELIKQFFLLTTAFNSSFWV